MQATVDAAALAGAGKLAGTNQDVRDIVNAYLEANLPDELKKTKANITITDDRHRVIVDMTGKVDATFAQVFGVKKLDIGVTAEAAVGMDQAEVVLALDSTGTMRNHMPALRQGATDLTTILFRNAVDKKALRVGIVPYVTAVNLGDHPARMNWMDMGGSARYHGENFEDVVIKDTRCDPPPPPPAPVVVNPTPPPAPKPVAEVTPPAPTRPPLPPPPPPKKTSPDLGALEDDAPVRAAALTNTIAGYATEAGEVILAALSVTGAQAAGSWPYGTLDGNSVIDCSRKTPNPVNHFDLFSAMNVPWKGCVEARPSPYDTSDEPPANGKPDTLFVPYLWPDEHDTSEHIRNNYLADTTGMPSWVKYPTDATLRQAWIWKYDGGKPNLDDASFLTRGPNAACPDPIVRLTATREPSRPQSRTCAPMRPQAPTSPRAWPGPGASFRLAIHSPKVCLTTRRTRSSSC